MTKVYSEKLLPVAVRNYLAHRGTISLQDLKKEFGISKSTAKNYLSRARKLGLGVKVAPQLISRGKTKIPKLTNSKKEIVDKIREKMPFADFVIWSTNDLNEFAHNLLLKEMVIIEAEAEIGEAIADALNSVASFSVAVIGKMPLDELLRATKASILIMKKKDQYGTKKYEKDPHLFLPGYERIFVDSYFLITRKKLPIPLSELGAALRNALMFGYSFNFSMLYRLALRANIRSEMSLVIHLLKTKNPDLRIPEKYATRQKLSDKKTDFVKDFMGI